MARARKASIAAVPKSIRIRKNDTVRVIGGKDKGKTGRVLEVNRDTGRILVEGVQMIKRHTRPNPSKQIKGGIAEKESSLHVSNVMLLTPGGVPTRISMRVEGAGAKTRRVRIARKTGEVIETKKG
jgi:large subunit ribosomal protein L24